MADRDCAPGWTCDTGTHECIPPSGTGCSNDDECLRADEPICDLAGNPPACRGCLDSAECTDKNSALPFCNTATGECMAVMPPDCTASSECTNSPTQPICDTSAGECTACTMAGGDTACMMRDNSTPYCLTTGANTGACAQCLQDTHCNATNPVCDTVAGTCTACKDHSDCDTYSGVCDAGSCADESEVVYVQQMNSSDTNDCSKGAPCTTINRALEVVIADKPNKTFLRILDSANYSENITLSDVTLSIIGNDDTRITGGIDNQPTISVAAGSSLTLDTLTIRSVGNNAAGIQCIASSSSVRLDGVIVQDNPGYGIEVSTCPLTVERSLIAGNENGGITVTGAAFDITNSFIVGNGRDTGTTTSNLGGVRIVNVDPYEPQFFAFNTIADNRAGPGASSGGVQCSVNATSTVTATSSIIRKGFGGKPTLAGDCVWRSSNIEEGETLGGIAAMANGNNYDDCGLANDGTGIYRFTEGSPCDNGGQADTGIDVDYEGQPRPATPGMAPDMGADEIVANPE